MATSRFILLSFDVEEFDMPLEYHQHIDLAEQLKVGNQGTKAIVPLLDSNNITCTLFTTANYAVHFPEQVKTLSQQHEIASHTYYHSSFKTEDLLQSRLKLQEITGKKVTGLRMPRMRVIDMKEVLKACYEYDSSINPTFLPGRYNNLHLPRTLHIQDGIQRLPASVSPHLRIPLFWLAFKNLPYAVFKFLAIQTLRNDGYLCLYVHPWEFTDINHYSLPGYTKKLCGQQLLNRLQQLINDLKKEGEFITIQSFLQQKNLPQ